jgi:hypothetical protein
MTAPRSLAVFLARRRRVGTIAGATRSGPARTPEGEYYEVRTRQGDDYYSQP